MRTDWVLIARLAAELEAELQGGRVVDGGLLDDGRFGLQIAGRRGRGPVVLAADLFGSPPVVTLEDEELAVAADPGWARAVAAPLRGLRVGPARSLLGDRVLVLEFGTTSRFGVRSGATLILELIPRFGNAVVLHGEAIVAAAKQFSPAENEVRTVTVGVRYVPPPLPALHIPAPLVAAAPERSAAEWVAVARRLAPIHVYRDGARPVAAHLVPLPEFAALEHAVVDRLLPVLGEERRTRRGLREGERLERRRAKLLARLEKRRADAEAELAAVRARRSDVDGRDRLRRAGDLLYTYGSAIPPGATSFSPPDDPTLAIPLDPALDAKANAARYFARYRKASDAIPHLERRIAALQARAEGLDTLAFEAERADAAGLLEVERAFGGVEGRPLGRAGRPAVRRPLRIERASGAAVYLGRSPSENEELTFRVARPDDLWFHARGIPGAHVVLQPAPGRPAEESDLAFAADLAARHSRGRNAARVEIDFTERKYVRRQRDAAPGLVWYTNARSRVGRPDQV